MYILTVDIHAVSGLGLDASKLSTFLTRIEEHYSKRNMYHHSAHAADVLQMLHVMVKRSLRRKGFIDSALTQLGYIMAAAVHDVDHYGE
jgi:hypothetical protein